MWHGADARFTSSNAGARDGLDAVAGRALRATAKRYIGGEKKTPRRFDHLSEAKAGRHIGYCHIDRSCPTSIPASIAGFSVAASPRRRSSAPRPADAGRPIIDTKVEISHHTRRLTK